VRFIGQQVVVRALFHASKFFVVRKTLRVGGGPQAPLGRDAARVVEKWRILRVGGGPARQDTGGRRGASMRRVTA
jgi:hypothetical protein